MAVYEDIIIDQGTDFTLSLELAEADGSNKNLTGFSAAGKVKKSFSSDSNHTFSFITVIPSPETDGKVNFTLTNTQTDQMKPGRYVYDVELSHNDSSGNTIIERILEGGATVTPSVTR